MAARQPLTALLSQAFVAFTLEFDNTFELHAPHRTTNYGGIPGTPWLVSRVFWDSILRFIPEQGITLAELGPLTGTRSKTTDLWLTRLSSWWGYLAIEPHKPRDKTIVRFTPNGRKAAEVWRPLTAEIETRWRERFDQSRLNTLHQSLEAIAHQLDPALPGSLPILGYGLRTYPPEAQIQAPPQGTLLALLAKLLYAFALEFEQHSELSLAIHANLLRLLGSKPMAITHLPRLSGVSKEAVATALGFLKKTNLIADAPGIRPKSLILTPAGLAAQSHCAFLLASIEQSWQARFGSATVEALHHSFAFLIDHPSFRSGFRPHPGNWRARVPPPETLPHYPMLLHRGGFPDGS